MHRRVERGLRTGRRWNAEESSTVDRPHRPKPHLRARLMFDVPGSVEHRAEGWKPPEPLGFMIRLKGTPRGRDRQPVECLVSLGGRSPWMRGRQLEVDSRGRRAQGWDAAEGSGSSKNPEAGTHDCAGCVERAARRVKRRGKLDQWVPLAGLGVVTPWVGTLRRRVDEVVVERGWEIDDRRFRPGR